MAASSSSSVEPTPERPAAWDTPAALVKRYFHQLTQGCGRKWCPNRNCRSCPDGHHSQVGVDMSGRRKSKTEVVVNRSFQAFPAYRITYQLRPGAALPNPLSPEGRGALQTLDEYLASDFHRSACSDVRL